MKALYLRGHINGKPVSHMLMDSGAIVNLMPYSLYKKLGGTDEELIKTNMTISGIRGGDPIGAKGIASMELTVGSKTVATAFFVSEVQGNSRCFFLSFFPLNSPLIIATILIITKSLTLILRDLRAWWFNSC